MNELKVNLAKAWPLYAASPNSTTLNPFLTTLMQVPKVTSDVTQERQLNSFVVKLIASKWPLLQKALGPDKSCDSMVVSIVTTCLANITQGEFHQLAEDNALKKYFFEHHVASGDYTAAGNVLSTLRMDTGDPEDDGAMVDDPGKTDPGKTDPYFHTPAEACDIYVQVAECFMEDNEGSTAENFVNKAAQFISRFKPNTASNWSLLLRFRSVFSRVLDSNRKFLSAGQKYMDLSLTEALDEDCMVLPEDLLSFLGMAATCAILSPVGPLRSKLLAQIANDDRLPSLGGTALYSAIPQVLQKMHRGFLLKPAETKAFEKSLQDHMKALTSDGKTTIVEAAILDHNVMAIAAVYENVTFDEMGKLLGGIRPVDAQRIVARQLKAERLAGYIDEVEGVFYVAVPAGGLEGEGELGLRNSRVKGVCLTLNECAMSVVQA